MFVAGSSADRKLAKRDEKRSPSPEPQSSTRSGAIRSNRRRRSRGFSILVRGDALARNLPKGHQVVESNCASHGRRHFVDEAENFPSECRYLLEMLGQVFKVDELCRTYRLSDEQRLRLHQRESGPVMEKLKLWMEAEFEEKRIEPNSGMGNAINYMLKRWNKFTLFLRRPGVPLHNNIVES